MMIYVYYVSIIVFPYNVHLYKCGICIKVQNCVQILSLLLLKRMQNNRKGLLNKLIQTRSGATNDKKYYHQ